MLPALNDDGELPAGIHVAAWTEFSECFGSFVSATPEPRDVDVVLVMASDFQLEYGSRASRTLFQHADAQADCALGRVAGAQLGLSPGDRAPAGAK
jgi:hypothetical protein